MIIGLTGLNASGKGAVAEYLAGLGFQYHSLSDVIRDVLRERGIAPTREAMIRAGRELRERGGSGVLAEEILLRTTDGSNHIVDSVRNPVEVEVLRRHPAFVLIEVTASEASRFERIKSRGRVGDPTDLETFRRLEAAELTGAPAGQQLIATAALADHRLANDGTVEELLATLSDLLAEISRRR